MAKGADGLASAWGVTETTHPEGSGGLSSGGPDCRVICFRALRAALFLNINHDLLNGKDFVSGSNHDCSRNRGSWPGCRTFSISCTNPWPATTRIPKNQPQTTASIRDAVIRPPKSWCVPLCRPGRLLLARLRRSALFPLLAQAFPKRDCNMLTEHILAARTW